jgi:hypothetical protein
LRNIKYDQIKSTNKEINQDVGDDYETAALKELLKTLEDNDSKNIVRTKVVDGVLQSLFIQLDFQLEWLQLYGQLFHIDGTFKVNCENYLLYVVMVQNSNGEGRPVAYCWMKAETMENLEFFYTEILNMPRLSETKVIIVDKDLTNVNLLKTMFPNAVVLLCKFHVIKWLKSVVSKIVTTTDVKNSVMFEVKAMTNAISAEIYDEAYKNFNQVCVDNDLLLENGDLLSDYFYRNWHNNREDWVFYFRLKLPTFGTNTNNHLESFNNNIKISVNHHLHLASSIKEIIEITLEYRDRQTLKNNRDFKRSKQHDKIKEPSIFELFKKVDDKAAQLMLNEYKLLDLNSNVNNYRYDHHGTGYSVYNECTQTLNVIKIEEIDSKKVAKCSCSSFIMHNLPCRHLLFIMKSVVDLNPFIQNRWLKYHLIEKENSDDFEPIESQYESVEPNVYNKFGKNSQFQDPSRMLDENQKFNKLKPLLDEISKLLCLSGQNEFDENFSFFNKHLETLRLNKRVYKPKTVQSFPSNTNEENREFDQDQDDSFDRNEIMTQYQDSNRYVNQVVSENVIQIENDKDNQIENDQIENDKENQEENAKENQEENSNGNLDYIDHVNSEENRRDGDPGRNQCNKLFLVAKTLNRRGRGKGTAAPFGYFAARGGITGNKVKGGGVCSNDLLNNSPSKWPSSGPGSRGGKGKLNDNSS